MRPDLKREYFHPVTKVLTRVKDLAKEFNMSESGIAQRVRRCIPLNEPPRRIKGIRKPKPPKKGPSASRLYNPQATVLGVNPITGELQSKVQLAKSLGISVDYARQRIRAGKTAGIKVCTEDEKLDKLNKKKAAQAEMAKLIAELDARKSMNKGIV